MTSHAQRFAPVTGSAKGIDAAVCRMLAENGHAVAHGARSLAPRRITVNSITPGLIDAAMPRFSLDTADDEKASSAVPLGRLGI